MSPPGSLKGESRSAQHEGTPVSERSLPHELTIYTVGELKPQWLGWLAAGTDDGPDSDDDGLAVDASAVAEVDAAGVQLLQSLAGALQHDRRTLQLLQPSTVLADACRALGLQALLDAPTGAPA